MPGGPPTTPADCVEIWEQAVEDADEALLLVIENPNSTTQQRADAWTTWDAAILAAKEAFQNCAGRPSP